MLANIALAIRSAVLLSLVACATEEPPEDISIDVVDEKADTTSACRIVASPLESFEAAELPAAPRSIQRTKGVRMRRVGVLGRCDRIESPWFRVDNNGDTPTRVQAKLGGVDKVFLRWLVRKTDADGRLVVQGQTANVLGPAGIELTGVIDGVGPQFATATLLPGERLETIAIPNGLGSRGFGWFPLPTFSFSQLP
ncbi:MAG: hypothetical protein H0T42_06780 [Deltaproteobacteria bacterium]|nr:hypothetical protein [Deltaproteobacteria bacterium]